MVGFSAGRNNGASSGNTFIGYESGETNTTGQDNTIIGYQVAQNTCTSGGNNVLIGTSSLVDCLTSSTSNEINIAVALIGFSSNPTLTSGWGTSPSAPNQGSTFAFKATVGASGTPTTTGVIGMPTAPTGWICNAQDQTSAVTARQSASSSTSVTFTWSSAPSNSDVILFQCNAYK